MKLFSISCLILLMSSVTMQAQNHMTSSTKEDLRTSAFMEQMNVKPGLNANMLNVNSKTSSAAMIQQIGSYNRVSSNAVRGVASVNYLQMGNSNAIESYNSLDNITERIIQHGDYNNVLNYSFGNVENATLNLIQSGNNQSFEKFGTNSQTNNLSFVLTGDNRSIIVRSY